MHKLNHGNRSRTPRAALFTKEKVSAIALADRWKDEQGITQYGSLPVSLHSNVYAGSIYVHHLVSHHIFSCCSR
jgi:hypothetical protein